MSDADLAYKLACEAYDRFDVDQTGAWDFDTAQVADVFREMIEKSRQEEETRAAAACRLCSRPTIGLLNINRKVIRVCGRCSLAITKQTVAMWREVASRPPELLCLHHRLNEEGFCRQCGSDCRGIGGDR